MDRDAVKRCFGGVETTADTDWSCAVTESVEKGRLLIGFIALTILCVLHNRMRKPYVQHDEDGSEMQYCQPLINEMGYEEVVNTLDPVVVLNAEGREQLGIVTEQQRTIAQRLGCSEWLEVLDVTQTLLP